MKITICITTFNEEKSIGRLLESLLTQTKKPEEIIIVDGGSNDQTTTIIKTYQKKDLRIKLLIRKCARAKGRNLAVAQAENAIIAMTDSGCKPDKDWLAKITAPFAKDHPDIVAGFYKMTAKTNYQKAITVFLGVAPSQFDDRFLPSARSIAFTKAAWKQVDGFPEKKANTAEDTDFNYQAVKQGLKYVRVKDAIVTWDTPRRFLQGITKLHYYAQGDAMRGIWWHPTQKFNSHNLKVISIFSRYFIGLLMFIYAFRLPFLLLILVVVIGSYLIWAFGKVYRLTNNIQAGIWGMIIQPSADMAIMSGFARGFVKHYTLTTALIAGIMIRLLLIFLDFGWDVNNHLVWAKDLWERGFFGFYQTRSSEVYASFYPNYPPLALYIFYLTYPLRWIIFQIFWWINLSLPFFPSKIIFMLEARAFAAGILKLPAILADMGTVWFVCLFAGKINRNHKKLSMTALLLFLFNPVIFYNSAYWGQIDIIPIFFVLTASYLLFFSRRYLASGILFTLSFLVKPTALVYLPVYTVFFLRKFGISKLIKTLVVGNLILWLAFMPFLKIGDLFLSSYGIYSEKILAAQSLPFVTNGAFNFWVLITGFAGVRDTASFLFGLSYKMWGMIIASVFYLFILNRARRLKDEVNAFLWSLFLSAYAAVLFLTKMHERYFILPLPFLLLVCLREKKYWKWFGLFSLTNFLNLYHSWPVPKIEFLAISLSHPYVYSALSLINVVLFFGLLRRFLFSFSPSEVKSDAKKRKTDRP